MNKLKSFMAKLKTSNALIVSCALFIVACLVCVLIISSNSHTAQDALVLSVSFQGEYKIADGEWEDITQGEHISATDGDVTLKGKFVLSMPDGTVYSYNPTGTYINFYFNHVSAVIKVGEESHKFDVEHSQIGTDACGTMWLSYLFPESQDGVVEIVISNPHYYGNASAVDDFLSNIRLENPDTFKNAIMMENNVLRYIGFSFIAVSLILLGIATVATILKIRGVLVMWVIGGWMFFTGGYYVMDAIDVFLWYSNTSFNTTALAICKMLSVFFLGLFVTVCMTGINKKISTVAHVGMACLISVCTILSAFDVMRIYDSFLYWNIAQALVIALLVVCGIREMPRVKWGMKLVLSGCIISFLFVIVDFLGMTFTWGHMFDLSKLCFGLMFVVVVCFGIYTIINNYKMSMRTKEMEAELKDKSIAVMISQIQPHFLYNSLNSIAELCVVDPMRAEKATIDFSRYLRGNMGALNEKKTIEFEDELNHLNHYIELEKIRYGDDLQFEFDIKAKAFTLPALTVQPLVENAVNHGIRYYKTKGKVRVSSYEDENNNYVCIEDDGVGFDVNNLPDDGKKHVGISNVRYRLKVMCNGSIEINSQKGKGTIVKIIIPKGK